MTENKPTRADADGGWKDIIEDFTEEFFEFYFPEVHREVDFSCEPTFLDKELQRITATSAVSNRHVDKLIRVSLRNGGHRLLFIHVEVQGETRETEEEFAERMYTYHYKVRDQHGRNVMSLAVLTDDDLSFHPTEYRWEMNSNFLVFGFTTVKLAALSTEKLESPSNVFGLVSRIQLECNRVRRDEGRRFNAKLALTRELYRMGYDRIRIVQLFRFLDFLMRLPAALEVQYREQLEAIEGELNMPYVTSVERLAKAEGRSEGRSEGRREGRSEGRREGELQGLREAVTDALEVRFGEVRYTVREAVRHVDSEKRLRELHRLAITVSSLDDFKV